MMTLAVVALWSSSLHSLDIAVQNVSNSSTLITHFTEWLPAGLGQEECLLLFSLASENDFPGRVSLVNRVLTLRRAGIQHVRWFDTNLFFDCLFGNL